MFGNMPRWRLFKIWGHEVFMEPVFLLLLAFFVFSSVTSATSLIENVVIWIPALTIGILWHELGHAIAIKRFGYGPSTIVLQGFGGVTINRSGKRPPKKSIIISLAGPAFSLSLTLIFGLAWYFYPNDDLLKLSFGGIAGVNGVLAFFNLLPINPLDGGHVLLHSLRLFLKNERKALLYTVYVSLALLAALFALSIYGGQFFLVIIVLFIGFQNFQIYQALKAR